MKNKYRRLFTSKNGITILCASVFAVFVVTVLFFTMINTRRVIDQNQLYLEDSALNVANSIDASILEGKANIKTLARIVEDTLTGPEFDVTKLQGYVRETTFDFVEFADAEGMDHNITGGISDARDRQYYLDAKAGNSGIELIYISRATEETLLFFYSPIYYEDEFVGSLIGSYQASNRISRLLQTNYFGEDAQSYLVSPDGRIIASSHYYNPKTKANITSLANGNAASEKSISAALQNPDITLFSLPANETGGCAVKVPDYDAYVVQIFPEAASIETVNSANLFGYLMALFILGLCAILFVALRGFYLYQQDKTNQSKNLAEESLIFTNYFLESYVSAYHVNLDDYSYSVYKRTDELHQNYPITPVFYDSLNDYIQKGVHPDDREALRRVIQPENIKKIIQTEREFTFLFRDISGETERLYQMQIIPGKGKNFAAFGFKDVTDEMSRQQKYLLGAIPLSPDVLTKANIGLWSFELDEGRPPRMYADKAMLPLIGLDHVVSPEETYHAWYDHIDEGSYDLVANAVEKMTAGEHAEVQYPWHHPDGRTMIVRCGGVRNFEYTRGIRIEGTHQNVTEVVHFDEAQRQKEKEDLSLRLVNLLSDSYTTLYYIHAESGNYQMISQPSEYQEKVQPKIANGGNFYKDTEDSVPLVIYPDDTEKVKPLYSREAFEAAFGDKDNFTIDYRVIVDEENVVWYRLKAIKVAEADTLRYAVGVMCLEEELEKEHQLTQALEMAQAANKAKTDFLFNMSHDIRTPMNAIVGFTNIAQKNIDDKERVLDCLDKTKQANELLLSLINSILDMSRIESGKAVVEQDEGDITMSFSSIEDTMRELANTKDINLQFEIGNVTDRYVYYDHNRCMRVIVNIISNAIKYTREGGHVLVKCEQLSAADGVGTYQYTVTDNGIGMSEEFQKHVFEEFSREHNSTTTGIQGTGLGLAVCKSFVELMGGTITCQSRQGEGTTFTVTLPFTLRHVDAAAAETAAVTEQAAAYSFAGKKVLLAEDNMLNREIALDLLEEEGMTVDCAENGAVAVEKIKENGPQYYDFVLMDIQMPEMDGYEATKAIRAMYPDDDIKIIAVSANAFAEDKAVSLAAGMSAHVAKPLHVAELLETMQSLM